MPSALFVSVAQSFARTMTIAQVELAVERAWPTTVSKAVGCDRVVAAFHGAPVAAWVLRGAYPAPSEVYSMADGSTRPRVALSLGEPLPVLDAYRTAMPNLRRGCAVVDIDVEPVGEEA